MPDDATSEINTDQPNAFRMGDWLVEPDRNRLSRIDEAVTIENKAMAVLVQLAARAGEVLSNEHLIEAVWDGRPMGDNPVYKSIAYLRKALGDDSKSPQYIETIARKGYRLVADVAPTSLTAAVGAGTSSAKRRLVVLGVALVFALLISMVWFRPQVVELMAEPGIPPHRSIAVLPFENLSADPKNDFFCHGIADELLNKLAQLSELRVVARSSSFSLGDQISDLPKFATNLGVRYLLTGSIHQYNDRLRVTARLLENNGRLVWTDSYDQSLEDIFSVQNDIIRAVMEGLELSGAAAFTGRAEPTSDFAAYSAYLLGSEYRHRRGRSWPSLAISAYQDAIRIDSNYAAPYAGLAITYLLNSLQTNAQAEATEMALATALRLDPNLAEAHAAAGLAAMHRGKGSDYRAAVKSLRHAIELNPSLVEARNWLSNSLTVLAEHAESLRVLEDAIVIDPLNPILTSNLARLYHANGQFDDARRQMIKALSYPDTQHSDWSWLAQIDEDEGKLDAALGRMKEAVSKSTFVENHGVTYAGPISVYYAQLGLFDSAEKWLAQIPLPVESHWSLATHYAVLAPQKRYQQLAEQFRRYAATLSKERPLTLQSRSLTGSFAVLRGEYEMAIQTLEPLFEADWVLQNVPGGSWQLIDTLHHLVIAHRKTGNDARARQLLDEAVIRLGAERRGRSHLIGNFLVKEAVTYRLLGQNELANQRFREAVDAGWRQYYPTFNTPLWDAFSGDEQFERLMAKVKEDVDRQRERVREAERSSPFDPPASVAQLL